MAQVWSTDGDLAELLQSPPAGTASDSKAHYSRKQKIDPEIMELRQFLSQGQLPEDAQRARKIAAQAPSFTLLDNIVHFIDSKRKQPATLCGAHALAHQPYGEPQWANHRALLR